MKRNLKYGALASALVFCALLLVRCAEQGERKIKLAKQPMTALMQDQVETIEIAAAQKTKVALLEFQSRTRRLADGWLSAGIKQKLEKILAQSQRLNLSPSRFVADAFRALNISENDLDNAQTTAKLASELNADVIVRGDYFFENNALHVNMQLRRGSDGTIMREFVHTSTATDTMEALNNIIAQMSLELRSELEEKSDIEMAQAIVTTTSTEAYRVYIEGVEKIEQFYMQEAIPLLRKAVELDTTFASAYHSLGHALVSLGQFDQARPILAKAVHYAQNLPDRERLPILAMHSILQGEYYKAVQLYNQVVDLYPEDDGVHYELGNYYFSIAHHYPKAIEKYETTVELNPKHKLAHNQLAYAYAAIGELERAFFILNRYIELAPDEPNPYDSYGEILQREGRIRDAIDMFEKALNVSPDFWHSRIHLASAQRDLGQTNSARRLLRDVLEDKNFDKYQFQTLGEMAFNEICAGNFNKAKEYFQQGIDKSSDHLGYKIALLYIEPESETFREYFLNEIREQLEFAQKDNLKPEKLLTIVSWALYFQIGIDLVDQLLDENIRRTTDPLLFQYSIAYKLIIDFFKGRDTTETEALFAKASDPATFKFAGPTSWDAYWRHYFNALRIADSNGVPIQEWTRGFFEFSKSSDNRHFEINSVIALAAAEFFAGAKSTAEQIMHNIGFPCEGDWSFVGPFHMKKGFHQEFWPEKVNIDDWSTKRKYRQAVFQKRDSLFDGYVNLNEIVNFSANQAVYGLLKVNSKNFHQVQLRFGINGRLKAWLNNEPVIVKNVRGDAYIDHYIANVKLPIGVNYLLVRLDNVIGELGFYFFFFFMNGKGIPDVEFQPSPLLVRETLQQEMGS